MAYTYCIWYRVSDDGPDTERLVRAHMARLACRAGVTARLLKKRDEPRLWMELYEGVTDPARFEAAERATVAAYDIDLLIEGARRIECFHDEAPVAPVCV
ncbi:MAG: DUF4936 family protein [Thiobacillaceae bacterium]|nr:DUF4936 family protein [Thiobacillaceae bacterium]MCX7672112.1 DUF4936 family protein [Thiobacillaceae bacterium]MDW8323138.1 DUF4936 family protein [Burkholderiales bacterium]